MLNTLNNGVVPDLVVSAGSGPALIVNRDLTNNVLISRNSSFSASGTDHSVIDPLGSLAVDGTDNIYALPQSGTPLIDIIEGANQWAPSPAQVASQIATLGLMKDTTGSTINTSVNNVPTGISTTGTPLLHGFNLVYSLTNQLIAANSTFTTPKIAFNKPGYYIRILANYGAASGADPFVSSAFTWQDTNNNFMATETWVAPASPSNLRTNGRGMVKASQLMIAFTNPDLINSVTISVTLYESTHHIARDDWRAPSTGAIGTSGSLVHQIEANIYGSQQLNVPASSFSTWATPLYSGRVGIWAQLNATATSACTLTMAPFVFKGGLTPQNSGTITIPANGSAVYQEVIVGRCPYQLGINNPNAGAVTVNISATVQEYSS